MNYFKNSFSIVRIVAPEKVMFQKYENRNEITFLNLWAISSLLLTGHETK